MGGAAAVGPRQRPAQPLNRPALPTERPVAVDDVGVEARGPRHVAVLAAGATVVRAEDDDAVAQRARLVKGVDDVSDHGVVVAEHAGEVLPVRRARQLGVELEILLRRLVRRVRLLEGNVQKKRPLDTADECHRVVANDLAGVVAGELELRDLVHVPVVAAVDGVRKVVSLGIVESRLVVEATARREQRSFEEAEVPLAEDGRLIARVLEMLRQEGLVHRDAPRRVGVDGVPRDAVSERVAARQQRSSRRRANGLDIVVAQPDARSGESVYLRGLDLPLCRPASDALVGEADVVEAAVVDEEEDEVWWRGAPARGGGGGEPEMYHCASSSAAPATTRRAVLASAH